MNLSDLSGQVRVDIGWHAGVINRVELSSTRPTQVTRLFEGKSIPEVLTIVPLLYSLCSAAQQVAVLRASESALGIKPINETEQVREALVAAETAREIGMRLFSEWMPDKSYLIRELVRWHSGIKSDLNWVLDIEAVNPGKTSLPEHAEKLQSILDLAFEKDVSSASFQHCVDQIIEQMPEEISCLFKDESYNVSLNAPAAILNSEIETDISWLAECLAAQQADTFCNRPDKEGVCFETSLWSKTISEGKAAEVIEIKNQLRGRMAALLFNLFDIPKFITAPKIEKTDLVAPGVGIVNAARGILIHRIEIEGKTVSDSVVRDYKIVAPTEWNFHPNGTFAQMLAGVNVGREQVTPLVESLIKLVDPCVDWQLNLETEHA